MKLIQEKTSQNQFSGYGADWVSVNGIEQHGGLLVANDVLLPWRPEDFNDLQREDFAAALAHRPELVLLGTGGRIQFPAPALLRDLVEAKIGVEVMDVGAVCRTFNALVGEGRRPVALILFA